MYQTIKTEDIYGPDWRFKTAGTIGSSKAAATMGKHRWHTPLDLYNRLVDAKHHGKAPAALPDSDDLRRGRIFEDVALELLADKYGITVDKHPQDTILMNPEMPWAHATPDGWIGTDIVEVKVPRPATVARCQMQGLIDEWRIQATHEALVAGARITHVAILDPIAAVLHYHPIEVDDGLAEQLLEAESSFYNRVINQDPDPAWDASWVEPEDAADKSVIDSPEVVEAAETILRLREIKSEAEDAIETASARFLELAEEAGGKAEVYQVPGLARIFHRQQAGRAMFDKAKAIKKYPDLAGDEYVKRSKPSRPFRIFDLRPKA